MSRRLGRRARRWQRPGPPRGRGRGDTSKWGTSAAKALAQRRLEGQAQHLPGGPHGAPRRPGPASRGRAPAPWGGRSLPRGDLPGRATCGPEAWLRNPPPRGSGARCCQPPASHTVSVVRPALRSTLRLAPGPTASQPASVPRWSAWRRWWVLAPAPPALGIGAAVPSPAGGTLAGTAPFTESTQFPGCLCSQRSFGPRQEARSGRW